MRRYGMSRHDTVPRRASWRRYIPAAVVSCLGVFISIVVSILVQAQEQDYRLGEFKRRAGHLVAAVQRGIDDSLAVLETLHAFYAASQQVERHEFVAFAQNILQRHAEIQALAWVQHLPEAERPAYEAAVQAEGYANFQITELGPDGHFGRAALRQVYFPIVYAEPRAENETVLGFDLASQPIYLEALQRACTSGMAVASAPTTLQQATGTGVGVLVFLPIYRPERTSGTATWLCDSLQGFAVGTWNIQRVVETSVQGIQQQGLSLDVYDGTVAAGKHLLSHYTGRLGQQAKQTHERTENTARTGVHLDGVITIAGRSWALLVHPTPEYLATYSTYQGRWLLVIGLLFTTLLGAYLQGTVRRTVRIERLAAELSTRQIEAGFLDEASKLFNSTLDLTTVLQQVAQLTTQVLGDSCTIFMLEEGQDILNPAATYHTDPEQAKSRNELLRRDYPLRVGDSSVTGHVAATGQAVLIKNAQTDQRIHRRLVTQFNIYSYIAVPMLVKGRTLGVLGTSRTSPGTAFTERDLAVAMAVADRAALAIENARLLVSTRHRQQQLQTILEIHRDIVGELDPKSLLPIIAAKARLLLAGYSVVLYRYDESQQLLLPLAWANPAIPGGMPFKLGEGVVGMAAAQRRGIMMHDHHTCPYRESQIARPDMGAVMAQPFLSAGQLLGAIVVTRRTGTAPFTAEDLALLETFAGQAVIALKNARLYEQERQARDAAEAKAQQLAILIAVSTALSAQLKLEDILDAIEPQVLQHTQFEQLSIALLDDDGQYWHRVL
jgi:GAF domain-containing protein/CHASE1-domain containing sensor protein